MYRSGNGGNGGVTRFGSLSVNGGTGGVSYTYNRELTVVKGWSAGGIMGHTPAGSGGSGGSNSIHCK